MKNINSILVAFFILFSPQLRADDLVSCFRIEGMVCNSCSDKIKKKLSSNRAIKNVAISVKDEIGEITYESTKISAITIEKLISMSGYKATKIQCSK